MKRRTKFVSTLGLAGLLMVSAAPAQAWNPFTEPPRVMWCKVWPSFCK